GRRTPLALRPSAAGAARRRDVPGKQSAPPDRRPPSPTVRAAVDRGSSMLALRPARRTSWMNRASGNLDVPRPRSVGALDLELVLANALETGGAECTAVRQPAHPAVPAYRVELVFVSSDRGEDPPTPELPLLHLVVVAL